MALLAAVELSAGQSFRGTVHDWIADDVTPEELFRPLQAAGLLWLAEDDGRAIGFAACEAFDDALHLWELAVRREAQGRGVGRALIAVAVAEARRRSLPAVTLSTFVDIPWNAPFYARLGFATLDAEEMGNRLSSVLAEEAKRGLMHRCAMRLAL